MFSKEEIKLAKSCYEAIKKISKGKWEWKSEVGEWVLRLSRHPQDNVGNIGIITQCCGRIIEFTPTDTTHKSITESLTGLTPLLYWEKVEGIMERMGYDMVVRRAELTGICSCTIHKNNKISRIGNCKSRQKAVMLAVIELGKEK